MFNKTIILALLMLGGCGFTPYGDIARDIASEKGAQAMDEGLVNAEWFVCNAASVGSIKRRYGRTRESAQAYNAICGTTGDTLIITEPLE